MEEILGVKGLNLLLCSFLFWFGLVLFNFVLFCIFCVCVCVSEFISNRDNLKMV